jgi:hypothetical protein
VNEVNNRFSLREVEATVEEGTLGEFTRLCQSRASPHQSCKDLPQNTHTAVRTDLHHVLARVRARRRHVGDEDLIELCTGVRIYHVPEAHPMWWKLFQHVTVAVSKRHPRYRHRRWPTEANDSKPPFA